MFYSVKFSLGAFVRKLLASGPKESIVRSCERRKAWKEKERRRSIYGMLIDRRGLFSGCRVYSVLLPLRSRTAESSEKRGRGAFRERAKEDYSDSFWLADFAFSNRPPCPSAFVPVIRYARWGENLEERGREEMKACRMVLPALR